MEKKLKMRTLERREMVDARNSPISSSLLSAWMYNFAVPYRTPAIAQIYGVSGLFTSTRCSRASIFMVMQAADAEIIPAPAHKKKNAICANPNPPKDLNSLYINAHMPTNYTQVKVKN
jgi:hypothetical protein